MASKFLPRREGGFFNTCTENLACDLTSNHFHVHILSSAVIFPIILYTLLIHNITATKDTVHSLKCILYIRQAPVANISAVLK